MSAVVREAYDAGPGDPSAYSIERPEEGEALFVDHIASALHTHLAHPAQCLITTGTRLIKQQAQPPPPLTIGDPYPRPLPLWRDGSRAT